MRISELSRQTGIPVATIKFYLRERLLAPGRATGRNQAQYDDRHRRRLLLIKAFTGIAQVDLSSVRRLLSAVDDERIGARGLFDVVKRILHHRSVDDGAEPARDEAGALLGRLGWQVGADSPGRDRLARAMAALRGLGHGDDTDALTACAEAADRLARRELELLAVEREHPDRSAAAVRAMLLDEAVTAIRQLAHEHHLADTPD